MEKTFRPSSPTIAQHLPVHSCQTMSLSTSSRCLLNTSRDGNSTTSLGNLSQCPMAPLVKQFFLARSDDKKQPARGWGNALQMGWSMRQIMAVCSIRFDYLRSGMSFISCAPLVLWRCVYPKSFPAFDRTHTASRANCQSGLKGKQPATALRPFPSTSSQLPSQQACLNDSSLKTG